MSSSTPAQAARAKRDRAVSPANTAQQAHKRSRVTQGAPELIVSCDVGTCGTSIAYEFHQDVFDENLPLGDKATRIKYVTIWPKAPKESDSVASQIMYVPKKGGGYRVLWSHQIKNFMDEALVKPQMKNGVEDVKLAKLALHDSPESRDITAELEEQAKRLGKGKQDFQQDFLICLQKYLFDSGDSYFEKFHSDWMDQNPDVSFVLGVPPSWNEVENDAFVRMAEAAGMTNVSIGSESEATTAFYASQHEESFQKGDVVITGDIGGGTLDMALYEVSRTNPLRFKEIGVADSAMCGGVFIDASFRTLLQQKYLDIGAEDLEAAVGHFEGDTKRTFNGVDTHFRFLAPNSQRVLKATCNELRDHVFHPNIKAMQKALQNVIFSSVKLWQDNAGQKFFIFGGGVAANTYIIGKLKKYIHGLCVRRNQFKIGQFHSSIATNAKGLLLLSGRNSLVEQRRTRKTIGLYEIVDYDASKHGTKKQCGAYPEPLRPGEWFVDYIKWLVSRNRIVHEGFEERIARELHVPGTMRDMINLFYVCDSSPPAADREYTLLKSKAAEEKLVADMKMKIIKVQWHFPDNMDKKDLFKIVGPDTYLVQWDILIKYENFIFSVSVEMKSKTGSVFYSSAQPLRIPLDVDPNAYLSLGALSTRQPRTLL